MKKPDINLNFQANSAKSEQSEKQDIAENLSRAPAISAEDPTRSTLHTGEQAQGVLDEAQTSGGAPSAGVNFAEKTVVEEGVETGKASVPQSVVARAGSPLNTSPSGESGQSDHQERVSSAETTVGPLPTADISAEFPDVTPEVEPNAPTLPTIPAVSPPQPQEEQNQAPKDVMLDGSSLSEDDEGAVVGTLTVFDPDSDGPHQFEVSDPRFEILDGQLRLKPGVALDHEDASSVEVDVTVTDVFKFQRQTRELFKKHGFGGIVA